MKYWLMAIGTALGIVAVWVGLVVFYVVVQ
jgi:hypothetical protein